MLNEKAEPVKKISISEIPEFIPEKVKDKYIELANKLIDMEILTKIDIPAFNMMISHYSLCVEANEKLKEYGTYQKDRKILRKNPACQILKDNSEAFFKYAVRFGLFPSAREELITTLTTLKDLKKY